MERQKYLGVQEACKTAKYMAARNRAKFEEFPDSSTAKKKRHKKVWREIYKVL